MPGSGTGKLVVDVVSLFREGHVLSFMEGTAADPLLNRSGAQRRMKPN